MPRNSQRGSRNNNPQGRNQYSNGWVDSARERQVAAAAAAAAAVGAGVFLWSRRNQISDQISNWTDQFSEWTSGQPGDGEFEMAGGDTSPTSSGSGRSSSQRGMSETGGGNASLGARSGGGGTTSSASGRGRARQSTPV